MGDEADQKSLYDSSLFMTEKDNIDLVNPVGPTGQVSPVVPVGQDKVVIDDKEKLDQINEFFDSQLKFETDLPTIEPNDPDIAHQIDNLIAAKPMSLVNFPQLNTQGKMLNKITESTNITDGRYHLIDSICNLELSLPKINSATKFTFRAIGGNTLHKILAQSGNKFMGNMDYFMLPSNQSVTFVSDTATNTWYNF